MAEPRACAEPGCACNGLDGEAGTAYCQSCGHAAASHMLAPQPCAQCDCPRFEGAAGATFCAGCGHPSASHGVPATAAASGAGRSTAIAIGLIAALGGVIAIATVVFLLRSGEAPAPAPAPEAPVSTQAKAPPKPAGSPRVVYAPASCISSPCALFWADAAGGPENALPIKGDSVTVSPTGSAVIVHRYSDEQSRLVDLASGAIRRIDVDLSRFSPDASRIATEPGAVSDNVIAIVDAESLKLRTIPLPGDERAPTASTLLWSPDSRYLLVETTALAADDSWLGSGLVLVDVEAATATSIEPARGQSMRGMAWSPDGTRFAYAVGPSSTNGPSHPGRVLVRATADPSAPPVDLGPGENPVWGPGRIAYRGNIRPDPQNGPSRHQTWTVDPDDPASRAPLTSFRWTGDSRGASGPTPDSWSADGRTIVGWVQVWDSQYPITIDTTTGRITRFRGPDGKRIDSGYPQVVSQDGMQVLIAQPDYGDGDTTYLACPLDGTACSRYLPQAQTVWTSTNWSAVAAP